MSQDIVGRMLEDITRHDLHEVDIDTDNGDVVDEIKDEDENDVYVVNNYLDTDGNVKVDIDTDNADAVDNIKDEDDHETENDDNIDDEEE